MLRTRWAYVLVPVGAALLTIPLTLVISGTSYFVLPVTQDLGIPRAAFMLHFSLFSILSLLSVPVAGRLAQRYGARRLVTVGSIWTMLGLFGLAISNSVWQFSLFGVWIGLTLFPTTTLIAVVIIEAWFVKHRGMLVGLAMGAGGVGGVITSAILPGFIEANGWRAGYLLLGGLFALLPLVSVAFFIRNRPQDVGLQPYGLDVDTASASDDPAELPGTSYRVALRSPQFWLLFVGVALFFSLATGLEHYPAHLVENGFDPGQLAGTMSVFYALAIAVLPLVGFLCDKLGIVRTFGLLWVFAAAGWITLVAAGGHPALMSTGIFLLLASGALGVLPPLLTHSAFGPRDYAGLVGVILPAGTLGTSIAAPLWGLAHDVTGTYVPALVAAPVVLGIGFVVAALAMRSARARWVGSAAAPSTPAEPTEAPSLEPAAYDENPEV